MSNCKKRAYLSKSDARKAIKAINRENKNSLLQNSYWCPDCLAYHITSMDKIESRNISHQIIKGPKIIFVGLHNKPKLQPLDSSTKSGKLIDAIINQIPERLSIKTNLYNLELIPTDYQTKNLQYIFEWMKRARFSKNDDCVVTLGQHVADCFKSISANIINLTHPAAIWSNKSMTQYAQQSAFSIKQRLK
jgi:hypothetical protein